MFPSEDIPNSCLNFFLQKERVPKEKPKKIMASNLDTTNSVLKLWKDHPGGMVRSITIHDGLEVAMSYRDSHPRAPNMQQLFRERMYFGTAAVSFPNDPQCLVDRVPSCPPSPQRRVLPTDAPLLGSCCEIFPLFTTVLWKSACRGRL
jgi:hypothetical protein